MPVSINFIVRVMKACLKRGHEVVVMPKTCTSKDNSWLGLAAYAWAGYVLGCSSSSEKCVVGK